MKTKIYTTTLIAFISLFLLNPTSFAQEEIEFEELMGMLSETFTDEQLDELSYVVPWDIKVTAYAHGDYSGDGIEDFVLAVRETNVTPKKTVDVYFIKGTKNGVYKVVSKKNVKYLDLTIEVAFLVKEGTCSVTNRDGSNWYFTTYKISKSNLIQVDKETFPIEFEKAGEN